MSERFDLWLKSLKPETGKIYGRYARRVFTKLNLTPDEALEKIKQEAQVNRWDTYSDLVNLATAEFTEHGRYLATFAIRSFLYKNGLMTLPQARTTEPTRVKDRTVVSWDEALAICAAASKPYNLAFKLMLHCGWGSAEFMRFNTSQNWERIKTQLANDNGKEYVRVEMPRGRKKNRSPFYSLIPKVLLEEVLRAGIQLPITASHGYAMDQNHKRINKVAGIPLDMAHHDSARIYLEKAWSTALKRAPVTVTGQPTPHEMRDTFRTRADRMECDRSVAEFAMGHEIDPLGYSKIFHDEAYIWLNLKKIYGPTPASIGNLAEENKQLKEELQKMHARLDELKWLDAFKEGFERTTAFYEKGVQASLTIGNMKHTLTKATEWDKAPIPKGKTRVSVFDKNGNVLGTVFVGSQAIQKGTVPPEMDMLAEKLQEKRKRGGRKKPKKDAPKMRPRKGTYQMKQSRQHKKRPKK